MRSDLDHLPEKQQEELARVRTILLDEFEAAKKQGSGGTSEWRKNGQVLKIILFGSYARSDWVDEPQNGYLSDFDLLIVVSHPKLTDIADYWYVAEDRILRDPTIGRTVNIIVHTLTEVNQGIERGEYFWTDIARDGVTLYELPSHPLAEPQPPSRAAALVIAEGYFQQKFDLIEGFLAASSFHESRGDRRLAAFNLHQAVEASYACFLLVQTFYFPRSHNIKFLRSLAEDIDQRLTSAWQRDTKVDRRRFELLKRAYVESRYSEQFDVSNEDLASLSNSAAQLRDLVAVACRSRIQQLRTSE
jgi:uncharacterized protein